MQGILTILVIITFMSACFNTPLKSSGKVSVLDYTPRASLAKSVTEAKSISSFDPSSMVETKIQAPSGALAGSTVMMPPGALAIAADLVIEESVPLSETSVASSLNLREDLEVKPVGAGLIIRPTSNVDLTRPLTIAMSLGSETGLWAWLKKGTFLQAEKNYAVFYKSMIHGELKDGVIPGNSLRMTDDNKVEFEGYFGAFWLCEMNFPIEERVEVTTQETVVNVDRVSVIEVAGIVTEEDIVVKAAVPEVSWSPVNFTYDADSRTVNLSAKIGPERTLMSCQVDLRSSVDAGSGSNADASSDLNYSVRIKKKEAHSLVGRFRCIDDMNRQTSSEWSSLLQVPVEPSPPVAVSLLINKGANYTAIPTVELEILANEAKDMYITSFSDCSSGGVWEPYNSTKSWTLTQSNSKTNLFVKFRNQLGSESQCISDSITHDDLDPVAESIIINSGDLFTINSQVTLDLKVSSATEMYLSNKASCIEGGKWEAYSPTKVWELDKENAEATVYAVFRDEAGNLSACISDTIIHDNIPPMGVSFQINSGNYSTSLAIVQLNIQAISASKMYITNNQDCSSGGTWEDYATTKSWILAQTNALATVYIRYKDAAGNESACLNDSIVHDNIGPLNPVIRINQGNYRTTSTSVALSMQASSATEMYITNNSSCDTGGTWQAFSPSKAWTLAQTNSVATVYAKFKDDAGNTSTCVNDTIVHQTFTGVVSTARAIINEINLYSVELYITNAGNLADFILTNKDGNNKSITAQSVEVGQYFVVYLGFNLDWTGDSITLLDNQAMPMDYVSWGSVNDPPAGLVWDYSIPIKSYGANSSLSLVSNGVDHDTSAEWEITGSGLSSLNALSCRYAGYGNQSFGNSNVASCPSPGGASAGLIINERSSNQVELYALTAGYTGGYILSNQEEYTVILADFHVNAGDYIMIYNSPYGGYGSTQTSSPYMVYTGDIFSIHDADDLVLLKPSASDLTMLANGAKFAAIPVDYVAFGANDSSAGSHIQAIPVSQAGVTTGWDATNQVNLTSSSNNFSLTPNGIDSDSSVSWEVSGSGSAPSLKTVGPTSLGLANNVINNSPARAIINEINRNSIELFVTQAGDLGGFVLTDQDGNYKTINSQNVNVGQYVQVYLEYTLDWDGDDILLLDEQSVPIDYVSWGNVNSPPAGITWNYALPIATYGTNSSISLVTDGNDQNTSADWEITGSGLSPLLAHSCRYQSWGNQSLGYSNIGSCPVPSDASADLIINERSGNSIELYATSSGSTGGYLLSNQGKYHVLLPDFHVNAGEYIIINSSNYGYSGSYNASPYMVYTGDEMFIDSADDLVLLKYSASDATILANGARFPAIPVDYVAFGVNVPDSAPTIQAVPVSLQGVTVAWNPGNQANLVHSLNNFSLTPNGVSTHSAASWEISGSGSASGPSSVGPTSIGYENVISNNSPGLAIINEVNPYSVELYVTQAGNLGGFILSDQNGHIKTIGSQTVSVGQYVTVYLGFTLVWSGDHILLLDNQGSPLDYVSWGTVNNPPAGISWNYDRPIVTYGSNSSISLVRDGNDQNTSADWEMTGSGLSPLTAISCRYPGYGGNQSMGFSNVASCPTPAGTSAGLIINERSSAQIELYVVSPGYTGGYLLTNQQAYHVLLPDFYVNAGEYIVISNMSYCSGGGYSSSPYYVYTCDNFTLNSSDDLVLLMPSASDSTVLANGARFPVIPVDYVAFGSNDPSMSPNIQAIPVSALGVTTTWNASNQANLININNNFSLSPNGVDSNSSESWQVSGSGNSAGPSTAGPNSLGSANTN